jgi:hypothetical protein
MGRRRRDEMWEGNLIEGLVTYRSFEHGFNSYAKQRGEQYRFRIEERYSTYMEVPLLSRHSWGTSLRGDRKELVEHVLGIVFRFELLQALVVHTKHVFGFLFVLYDVLALR